MDSSHAVLTADHSLFIFTIKPLFITPSGNYRRFNSSLYL